MLSRVRGFRALTHAPRMVRQFSGHSAEDHAKEVATWRNYSVIMAGLTAVFTVYNIAFHSHDHVREGLPYMHIRNRPFPWKECPDCEFFNMECWRVCRGGEPKEEEHH